MLRDTLLYLSNQPRVFRFVRDNRLAKHFAKRFVAGETLAEALDAVRGLNARGITASLDLLGESVSNEREARAARDEYLNILQRIHESKLNANVSVKLTAMGLDVSEGLCIAIMQEILERVGEGLTGDEPLREVPGQPTVADELEDSRLVREVQERVAKH